MVLKKEALALQYASTYHRLFKQASTCGYCCKDKKIIHAALNIINNQNEMIKLAKVKNVNSGRISDNKNNFVSLKIVSIVASIPTHLILNHMKHIDVPKTTK